MISKPVPGIPGLNRPTALPDGRGLPGSPTNAFEQYHQDALAHYVGRNLDEILYFENHLCPPTIEANLVTVTVPPSHLYEITHICLWYNDPAISLIEGIPWAVCVNGNRLPHVSHAASFNGFFYRALGDPFDLFPISSIWVNSSQTVSIRVYPTAPTSLEAITVLGILAGRGYQIVPRRTNG